MRTLFLMTIFWGSIPLFYVDPFYGIVHYTLISIIRPEQLLWGGGVGRIYMAGQINIFLAWLVNKNSKKLTPEYTPLPLQIKLIVLVAIGMSLSVIFAVAPQEWCWRWTWQFIRTIIPFCFVMSKSMNTTKKLEWYYIASLIWLMFLQMWGIQQKLGGNARMEGLGGDQLSDVNDLASIAVLYFPMAYYMLFNRKRWIKWFVGIPTTIVSIIFILFGGSRGAAIGLAICLVLIFLRTPGLKKFNILITALIIGFLLYVVLTAIAPEGFFDEYTARLQTIFGKEDVNTGEVEYEGSAAGRIAMWKASYHLFRQHPEFWLTGVGMAGFPQIYGQYLSEIEPYLSDEDYAYIALGGKGGKAIHNTFINVATGGGILTFFPWLFLLLYSVFQAHTIPRKYPKIVAGVDIHNYAQAIEIGLLGAFASISFINAEFVDFYYWFLVMPGIITNIGRAQLIREKLGKVDEEFDEMLFTPRSKMYSASYS